MRSHSATVAGPMQAWRTLSLSFDGPVCSEDPETFTDIRLEVALRDARSGEALLVQGFFAADGAAADSGAAKGGVWRAAFTPPSDGEWVYRAAFRTGPDIAAESSPEAGTPHGMIDGVAGRLWIAPARAGGPDLRGLGPVALVDEGYAFPRSGAATPERFDIEAAPPLLLSAEFDGLGDAADHSAAARIAASREAWRSSDPVWARGRGKAVIGALNRMAEEGLTALWAAPMVVGVDGAHGLCWRVSPWSDGDETGLSYDVSRLAQWEIVFTHAQSLGLVLNIDLGWPERAAPPTPIARRVFLREMVARFAHHNGLVWRLRPDGEDAAFLRAIDPYQRPIAPPLAVGRIEAIRVPRPAAARMTEGARSVTAPRRNGGPAPVEDRPDSVAAMTEAMVKQGVLVETVFDEPEPEPDPVSDDPQPKAARERTQQPERGEDPLQPPIEPFETRLEQGLRRLQAALGWGPADAVEQESEQEAELETEAWAESRAPAAARRVESVLGDRATALDAAPEDSPGGGAKADSETEPTSLASSIWRGRFGRRGRSAREPASGSRARAAETKRSAHGGVESIELSPYLLAPSSDRPELTPIDVEAGLTAAQLSEEEVNLVVRVAGDEAERVRSVKLSVDDGDLSEVASADPYAIFEDVGEPLAAAIGKAEDGEARLRLELYESEDGTGSPLRWWSAPLRRKAKPAEETLDPAWAASGRRRRARAGEVAPAVAGMEMAPPGPAFDAPPSSMATAPLELRSVELIDAEADRPIGELTGRGVIDRRDVLGRPITLKVTIGGDGVAAVETVRATLETARSRQTDADRPFGFADERVAHFYRLALERGEQALLIEAYAADERMRTALLAVRVEFVVS